MHVTRTKSNETFISSLQYNNSMRFTEIVVINPRAKRNPILNPYKLYLTKAFNNFSFLSFYITFFALCNNNICFSFYLCPFMVELR